MAASGSWLRGRIAVLREDEEEEEEEQEQKEKEAFE